MTLTSTACSLMLNLLFCSGCCLDLARFAGPLTCRLPLLALFGFLARLSYQKWTDALSFQEYFATTIGPVKKVILNYNKTGRSVGIATIVFHKATSAADAAKQLDTVKIDGRPMKVRGLLGVVVRHLLMNKD